MTKPVFATCDKCGEVFSIEYKETQHPKGVRETYFTCNHCGKHYTCFVTDDKVRMMQRDIRKIHGLHNANGRMQLQEEINQRMVRLKGEIIP